MKNYIETQNESLNTAFQIELKTAAMKFKQLHIGQKFDFDRSTLSWPLNIEPGPWVKISARKYTKAISPFSLDYHERNEHALWSQLNCQVGTINVLVVPA